jgi:hypothetical protein
MRSGLVATTMVEDTETTVGMVEDMVNLAVVVGLERGYQPGYGGGYKHQGHSRGYGPGYGGGFGQPGNGGGYGQPRYGGG